MEIEKLMSKISTIKDLFIVNEEIIPEKKYSYIQIEAFVKETIKARTSNTFDERGKKVDDFHKDRNKRKVLTKNLKRCGIGDISAKKFIKGYIEDIVTQEYGLSEENIDFSIDFNNPNNAQDKFDIILLRYTQKYKFEEAIGKLIEEYKLDERREIKGNKTYAITDDDIDYIYKTEDEKQKFNLQFEEKLKILCQRIYQNSRGLSVIDEIRDMDIDGITIGTSGVPEDFMGKLFDMELKSNEELIGRLNKYPLSYDSIFLYYKNKEIHLRFMSLGSFKELERVCKTIYKFNNYTHFSRDKGYIFGTMVDLTRAVVFRPPFCACWVAFMRKEDKELFIEDFVPNRENADLIKGLAKFTTKARQKIFILGNQGLGKTALLKVLVDNIYFEVPIRVWEDFFEAYLNFKYPLRNIANIKTTPKINGGMGIDLIKKTNGRMLLIPEAADDVVINSVVKICKISSESIICCHHATSDDNLVRSMISANMNTGSTNEDSAEEEAIKSLGINYHLGVDDTGKRCIAKITEIIPVLPVKNKLINVDDMFKKDTNEVLKYTFTLFAEYIQNKQIKKYRSETIAEYDIVAKKYVIKSNLSKEKIEDIKENLYAEDQEEFSKLISGLEHNIESKVAI